MLKALSSLLIIISFSYPVIAQSNGITIEQADRYFISMDYDKAIDVYVKLLKIYPESYDLNWKTSRVFVNYGEVPGNEKKNYFENSRFYAQRSIQLNPSGYEGYTFLAAAIGNLAFWGDNKQKIDYSIQMVSLLNKSLTINPNDPIALSIYGSLERVLSSIGWFERTIAKLVYNSVLPPGNLDNSVNYFKKAIELDPKLIRHHYELSLTYIDLKDFSKAKDEFRKALACPIVLKADYRRIELINNYLKEIK